MTLRQCNLFLSAAAAAVQRQSSVVLKTAESVNLEDIPESSFHRCSGFVDSMQLPDTLLPEARESWRPHTGSIQPDEPVRGLNLLHLETN